MSVEENKALVRRDQAELWNHTGNFVQGRWNGISLLQPPFGKRADALLNFFLR